MRFAANNYEIFRHTFLSEHVCSPDVHSRDLSLSEAAHIRNICKTCMHQTFCACLSNGVDNTNLYYIYIYIYINRNRKQENNYVAKFKFANIYCLI